MSMSKDPIGAQSDILGRPFSLNRVHVVDSSVLPTIPSGTITLTVMANSYRIASSISLKDGGGLIFMRIAITGANGFLGTHLVNLFRLNGVEVISMVRSPKDRNDV